MGIGNWESGIGHRVSGIGYRASGIGNRVSGIGQCMGFNLYKEAGKRKMKSFEIALFGNAKANVTHNATAVLS